VKFGDGPAAVILSSHFERNLGKPFQPLFATAPVMPESGIYDPDQADNRGGKAAERGGKSEDLPG